MSFTFQRAVIRNQWRFVHRCDELAAMFTDDSPIDADSIAIIYGYGERWWLRDKENEGLFPVSYCPGCGKELAEQFSALERLGRLDPAVIGRMPELKGLE